MKILSLKTKQTGSTLIEVLIALLVFSIGLQGIASMQFQAVKENFDSSQRSHGIWAAQELINRIRANPDGWVNDSYAANGNPCGVAPTSCVDNTCNATEMAAFDVWDSLCTTPNQSHTQGQGQLLNLNLIVSCADADGADALACSPGSAFTFNMQWQSKSVADEAATDDTLKTQQFLQVFRP